MVCSTTLSTSFTRSTAVSHESEKGNSGLLRSTRDSDGVKPLFFQNNDHIFSLNILSLFN